MKHLLVALIAILLISCGKNSPGILLKSELNTGGTRHRVGYNADRPVSIRFESFNGSGSRDTTITDSGLRVEVDSITYNDADQTISLIRTVSASGEQRGFFRKYYFNEDDLLVKITRFSPTGEYVTDSVKYDYTKRTAMYVDLINKHVYELAYDTRNNIETMTEKRTTDQHLFRTIYYYYDASRDPFLVNIDDSEELFGCFRKSTVGLFWNNAARPVFSSKNNVQAYKEIKGDEENAGLYEYQYRQGVPLIQYGNSGVLYYTYSVAKAD